MARNGEIPLTEEVIKELENHKKVDGKREKKGSRIQKRQKGAANSEAVLELDRQEAELERSNRKKKDDNKNNIAPVEIKSEVKIKEESQIQTEEPSAIEKPEEKTTDDLERKKEKTEELEKREKELLEIFEQNKNKPWVEKKDVITAAINELEKVRAEKAETEKKIADSGASVPAEDLESDYEIIKKRTPTDEEREKLNPLLTKTTNAADIYIPEKFIEEEPNASLGTKTEQIKNDKEGFIKGAFEESFDIISEKHEKILEMESKLAAMEAETLKVEKKLEGKDATKWEKFKKFWGSSKGKTLIACALVGGIYAGGALTMGATGGASAPLYFGVKALVAKMGGSLWLPYAGGSSSIIGGAAMGGAIHWLGEKIGAIKTDSEAKAAMEGFIKDIQKIKNADAGSEQRPTGETAAEAKTEEPQIAERKTEKPEGKKENFLNKIFGKRGNKDEEKPEGLLIKKTERMKKTAPETEDKFGKKAEDVKVFVEQLKEGKKTGKEIFEYLENLRHNFVYPDRANFNLKIKPEIDKLSKKEKTDMVDLSVEYLMSKGVKGAFNTMGIPLVNDLHYIMYGKDFTKEDYIEKGKKENVQWLYGETRI